LGGDAKKPLSPQVDIDLGDMVLAQLSRFYGLEPDVFLNRMPLSRFRAYIQAMQYIQAREQMDFFEAVSLPHLAEEKDRRKIVRCYQYLLEKITPPKPDTDKITRVRRKYMKQGKKKRGRKMKD
jgi:hypothetical protein